VTDIVLIGAGAAGIGAARRLRELRQDFIHLEAKPTIGGRCVTDRATLGAPVDLGAHWLHSPLRNPMKDFADRYGIRYAKAALANGMTQEGRFLTGAEEAACLAHVDTCFDRVTAAGQKGLDIAVADLLSDAADDPWHGAFLAELVAKQGVTADRCSTLDFTRYVWEGDDLPVTDGYGSILAAVAGDLDITCDTPVTRIDWSERNGIRITTANGIIMAKRVILTVSTALLAEGIDFHPALPSWKRDAIADLPMGSCNKVTLRFAASVFGDRAPSLLLPLRGRDSVEIVLREGGLNLATCLFNGPLAKALSIAGPEAMADYALERLVEIFGTDLRRTLIPAKVVADWDNDAFTRGCFSAARPGRADARFDLARPIDNRLYFAGEACALDYIGDVHGAWFSGIAAAEAAERSLVA
jgi:monoamine oxidase